MVDVLTDVIESVHEDFPSEEETSSSSSSDEEDDKIRIYDVSPQTLTDLLANRNLWVDGISDDHPVNVLEKLLDDMDSAQFGPSSYFQLIDILQDLMDNHGAKFCRYRRNGDVSTIHLDVGGRIFDFNERKRTYLSFFLTPIHNILYKKQLQGPLHFCCIYRFHCIKCHFRLVFS